MTTTSITIEGTTARVGTPEGQTITMPLEKLLALVAGQRIQTCGAVMFSGFRLAYSAGPVTILVCEQPPGVRGLKWIAAESPARYGAGTVYRTVRVALPYVVVFAVFDNATLSGSNEAFFRVRPLEDENDELCYPALLNCSRFQPPEGRPLSWICTQKLDRSALARERDAKKRLRAGLKALLHCLFETGFNYSSENHEFSSWFTESTRVDRRISTIERWEEATQADPLFILDLPFLRTEMTVAQVAERIFQNHHARRSAVATSQDLARLIINHAAT